MNRKRASIRCVRPPAPRGDFTWAQPSIILLGAGQQADYRYGRLLRARRERPRGRASEQRDEVAPVHSITSSARARRDGGMSRPSALAVGILITNSNLVDCTTGSPGFESPESS